MRRAEMARRRKNLSEKRNEEEKVSSLAILVREEPTAASTLPTVKVC